MKVRFARISQEQWNHPHLAFAPALVRGAPFLRPTHANWEAENVQGDLPVDPTRLRRKELVLALVLVLALALALALGVRTAGDPEVATLESNPVRYIRGLPALSLQLLWSGREPKAPHQDR